MGCHMLGRQREKSLGLSRYRPTRVVPDQRPLNGRCCCCLGQNGSKLGLCTPLVCGISWLCRCWCFRTSSGDVTLLLSPMRLASLQQLCRIAIRRLLSRDKIEHLLFMPPPIRRYLQYDRQPLSACGWVLQKLHCCVGLSVWSCSAWTDDRYACLALCPHQQFYTLFLLFCLYLYLTNRSFSCVIFCCKCLQLLKLTDGAYTFAFDVYDVICYYYWVIFPVTVVVFLCHIMKCVCLRSFPQTAKDSVLL